MNRLKIGIRLESLCLPLRRGLMDAERLGVSGVQLDAVGDLSPDQLSQTGRREVRHLLRAHSLELTALGCPLRRGLDALEDQQLRIEHVKKVMSLSFELGPRIAIVEAGEVVEDDADPRMLRLSESLRTLSQQGDREGVTLALETGLESGATLRQYLARFDTGSLGVNLDPANLLMHGFDVHESVRALHDRIVHTHAKDARRHIASRAAQETPLGQGDIDWLSYLGVLEEIGYRGWLTIERESGNTRLADVAAAVQFLRRLIP